MNKKINNRQKSLLNLLQLFGGELNKTDCQKLMFLFCNVYGKTLYSFFPYRFGSFSYILNQDKSKLREQGFLRDTPGYSVTEFYNSRNDLKCIDYSDLIDFAFNFSNIRGENLINYVYNEFPYFASNSEIKDHYLSKNMSGFEYCDTIENEPCLLSLGYEGLSIDEFLNKLNFHKIKIVIDVRKKPVSRKYGFSKNKLEKYLSRINIAYHHFPNLGVSKEIREKLGKSLNYVEFFHRYKTEVLKFNQADIKDIVSLSKSYSRMAIMCFEKNYKKCHRYELLQSISKLDKSIIIKNI